MGLKARGIRVILSHMGFTKKQRREQKKHALTASRYEKVKHKQRRRREYPDQPTDIGPGQDTAVSQPGPSMVLVKTSWTEPGGDLHQDFQLVEVPAGRDQEDVRKYFLANLQAQRVQNGSVELFDPDNVPPGTIPPGATVTLNKPLFNN